MVNPKHITRCRTKEIVTHNNKLKLMKKKISTRAQCLKSRVRRRRYICAYMCAYTVKPFEREAQA